MSWFGTAKVRLNLHHPPEPSIVSVVLDLVAVSTLVFLVYVIALLVMV